LEISRVVVFSRLYNYYINIAVLVPYIYPYFSTWSFSNRFSKLIVRPYKPPPSGDSTRKRGRIEPNRVKTDCPFDCPETVRPACKWRFWLECPGIIQDLKTWHTAIRCTGFMKTYRLHAKRVDFGTEMVVWEN
jgi:hypothetical protein